MEEAQGRSARAEGDDGEAGGGGEGGSGGGEGGGSARRAKGATGLSSPVNVALQSAMQHALAGRTDQAIDAYAAVVAKVPDCAEAFSNLAHLNNAKVGR